MKFSDRGALVVQVRKPNDSVRLLGEYDQASKRLKYKKLDFKSCQSVSTTVEANL